MTETTTKQRRWWGAGGDRPGPVHGHHGHLDHRRRPPQDADRPGFSAANLSWAFNAYVVAFGGLLLLGGRLSDLFGARRIFTTGWAVILVGSVVAAVAGSAGVELAGRALQGVGAALIAPSALALLFTIFGAQPTELTKAISLYGAAAPAGGTAGVFLGGVITQWLSWPWIFWLYVPIAVAALLAIPALMPAGASQRGKIDVTGAVAASGGLALAVFGIVRAPNQGWGSARHHRHPGRGGRPARGLRGRRSPPAGPAGPSGHLPHPPTWAPPTWPSCCWAGPGSPCGSS